MPSALLGGELNPIMGTLMARLSLLSGKVTQREHSEGDLPWSQDSPEGCYWLFPGSLDWVWRMGYPRHPSCCVACGLVTWWAAAGQDSGLWHSCPSFFGFSLSPPPFQNRKGWENSLLGHFFLSAEASQTGATWAQ